MHVTYLRVNEGTNDKVLVGGYSVGYSFSLANYRPSAIHEHTVAKMRLAGQGWAART